MNPKKLFLTFTLFITLLGYNKQVSTNKTINADTLF